MLLQSYLMRGIRSGEVTYRYGSNWKRGEGHILVREPQLPQLQTQHPGTTARHDVTMLHMLCCG